jgi:SAM-dependent methyltransferase
VVVGGLHHLHPHMERAIAEFYRVLKPGGYLCFVEPHTSSLANLARRLWYRFDGLFEKNEQAIDVDALQYENSHRFEFLETRYAGNVGYLFVLNSMVFRVPSSWKKHYAPACFWIESVLNRVFGKRLSCFVASRWRKRM